MFDSEEESNDNKEDESDHFYSLICLRTALKQASKVSSSPFLTSARISLTFNSSGVSGSVVDSKPQW